MTTVPIYPHAELLSRLQLDPAALLPVGLDALTPSPAQRLSLRELLRADAQCHAARQQISDVADLLRRDQKFVRPGPPSPQLLRLRQQQAAARQAATQAQLAYVCAARELVQGWALAVPSRLSLENFVRQWLQQHLLPA